MTSSFRCTHNSPRLSWSADAIMTHSCIACAAEAARKRLQEVREELRGVHDKLDHFQQRNRSRTGTPESGATGSGTLQALSSIKASVSSLSGSLAVPVRLSVTPLSLDCIAQIRTETHS